MPDYRLYWIDGGGHFSRAEHFAADDDAIAVERARMLCGAESAELWEGARKIATFSGSGSEP